MQILNLTAISTVPNEEGEALIDKAMKPTKKDKDPNKLSKEWFREQGLVPPDDAEDDEPSLDEDGMIHLKEEHLQEIALDLSIPLKNIDSYVESSDHGTLIYTKSGIQYHVVEETFEIDSYIEYITMGWFKRNKILFFNFFRRIKYKLQGKKVVNLQEILDRPEN